MAAIRQSSRGQGWIERDVLMRRVANNFGFERLGASIKATLKGHMKAAIRRRILESDGDCIRLLTNSLTDFSRDELRDVICSVIKKRTFEREKVVHAVANHLGFRRVTENARRAVKSAINSGIRKGLLGYKGNEVWKNT